MSVYEYKEGEHKGDFVGFRVHVSLGHGDYQKQAYFSLKKYSYDDAKKLAYEAEKIFKKEAEQTSKEFRLKKKNKKENIGIILPGLRARIITQKKTNGEGYNFSPSFIVTSRKAGGVTKSFSIRKHGYKSAYIKATKVYRELYEFAPSESLQLMTPPDKTIFTEILLKQLKEKGFKLTKAELISKLD